MTERLDVCFWCKTDVYPGVTGGGMEPVFWRLRWWHQGCVADQTRAAREVPQMQEEAQHGS